MTTKEFILAKLFERRGERISGAELAQTLGITRSAVWKAIQELNSDGYKIDGVRNVGYCLAPVGGKPQYPSASEIKALLNPKIATFVFHQIDSTNIKAREMAQTAEYSQNDCLIVASEQTAGRGRLGRSFFSPDRTGLYMSLLLHPKCAASESILITTAAAVAAARAINHVSGKNPQIKWVNDLYLDGKKICGILTEAQFSLENSSIDFAVLGIGFNVIEPEGGFPAEISNRAGAIYPADSPEIPLDIFNSLVASFTNEFYRIYPKLDKNDFLPEYRSLMFLSGSDVLVSRTVSVDMPSYKATVIGIDDDFRLIVRLPDGTVEYLSSGEVTLKI